MIPNPIFIRIWNFLSCEHSAQRLRLRRQQSCSRPYLSVGILCGDDHGQFPHIPPKQIKISRAELRAFNLLLNKAKARNLHDFGLFFIWVRRFELPASWTPFKHATKLRYTQKSLGTRGIIAHWNGIVKGIFLLYFIFRFGKEGAILFEKANIRTEISAYVRYFLSINVKCGEMCLRFAMKVCYLISVRWAQND